MKAFFDAKGGGVGGERSWADQMRRTYISVAGNLQEREARARAVLNVGVRSHGGSVGGSISALRTLGMGLLQRILHERCFASLTAGVLCSQSAARCAQLQQYTLQLAAGVLVVLLPLSLNLLACPPPIQ